MELKLINSRRLIVTMAMSGGLSGLILVGVYLATLPIIKRNQAAALKRAVFKVLPNTHDFRILVPEGAGMIPFQAPEEGAMPEDEAVYQGLDAEGHSTGFAIPAEGSGYADTIKVLFGYQPADGLVVGLEVLESRETPGLGDKIIFDVGFHANFKALQTQPEIMTVKTGTKTRPNEVDGISGATISSKAIVKILNKSLTQWRPLLPLEDSDTRPKEE